MLRLSLSVRNPPSFCVSVQECGDWRLAIEATVPVRKLVKGWRGQGRQAPTAAEELGDSDGEDTEGKEGEPVPVTLPEPASGEDAKCEDSDAVSEAGSE